MTKTEDLIKRLNSILSVSGQEPLVSPTTSGGTTGSTRSTLFITPDIEVEKLSHNELLYVHTMLHKLYNSGARGMTKEEIKILHDDIKNRIDHVDFDGLDKNDRRRQKDSRSSQ